MSDKDKQIGNTLRSAGYFFPKGRKVRSTKKLTIDERLYIALNRIHNEDTGEDGISRKKLAHLFGDHRSSITMAAKGDRQLSLPLNIFRYLFKQLGLPYKDLEAPDPEHYNKDLPASLRKYKEQNDI